MADSSVSAEALEQQLRRCIIDGPDSVDPILLREAADALAAQREERDDARRVMWLNHGCAAPYGDDGEMQCNASHQNEDTKAIGPLDFRRDDLHRLQSAILSLLRYYKRRAEQVEAEVTAQREALTQLRDASPVLDFQAWAEQRRATRGPMTQDEYFLAQEAFYAAHPGKGPSSTVTSPKEAR